jgi:hypothetical protein
VLEDVSRCSTKCLATKTKFVAQEDGGRRLVIFFPQDNEAGEKVRKGKRKCELE